MAQLLHGTAIQAFWAGTSYLLASTVLQPIIGSFSHIFGRKPLVLISVFFFTAGIIIASVANDFTVILVGRSIQGVGGGGILTMIEIIVTDLVPLRVRGQYYSLISSMWAIGSVAGPILGMLAHHHKQQIFLFADLYLRWWLCSKCYLEMDLLDQSPYRRYRRCPYRLLP